MFAHWSVNMQERSINVMCIIKQGRKLELGFSLESCTYSTTLKEGGREGILQQDIDQGSAG